MPWCRGRYGGGGGQPDTEPSVEVAREQLHVKAADNIAEAPATAEGARVREAARILDRCQEVLAVADGAGFHGRSTTPAKSLSEGGRGARDWCGAGRINFGKEFSPSWHP
jgi:hypothetical protein